MWPGCTRKDWRGKSCWLHPRESGSGSTKDQLEWLHPPPCLVPFWCGAIRTIWYCWKPRGMVFRVL